VTLAVRAITAAQHRAWVAGRPSVSFLQVPEWGDVKSGWRQESLGWFDGQRLVGAGLVLYRPVPRLPQRSLAYLPEGPDIDWLREEHPGIALDAWLAPLLAHCR
jgi:vancomycin resistance protein VanK